MRELVRRGPGLVGALAHPAVARNPSRPRRVLARAPDASDPRPHHPQPTCPLTVRRRTRIVSLLCALPRPRAAPPYPRRSTSSTRRARAWAGSAARLGSCTPSTLLCLPDAYVLDTPPSTHRLWHVDLPTRTPTAEPMPPAPPTLPSKTIAMLGRNPMPSPRAIRVGKMDGRPSFCA